jgi:hypothetical protein
MNFKDFRLRWPYYLLLLLTTYFIYINSDSKEYELILTSIFFVIFRISFKYYWNIEKPWKLYLFLAVILAFYTKLYVSEVFGKSDKYIFTLLSFYCLICIFILLMRNPQKYDSAFVMVFNFAMLAIGSAFTTQSQNLYSIEVYILTALSIIISIFYSKNLIEKFYIKRTGWFIITIGVILIIVRIFDLNNSRIENYFNSFSIFNQGSNYDNMSLSSLEKSWKNKDELNKVILRAECKEAPKYLKITTYDSFANNEWKNSIVGKDVKLDSININDSYYTRLFNSPKPNFDEPDCTVYLSLSTSGQLLLKEDTTWVKTSWPLKKMEGNGYLPSNSGRGGYALYNTSKRESDKPIDLEIYNFKKLLLPENELQYIKQLSDSMVNAEDTKEIKIKKIHSYLIKNHAYDLYFTPPKQTNQVIYFLKNKSSAHCQYFSSSAVFLLRAQNIPARIVNGYLCIRYNSVGRYWISKGIDAHAWVEYYDNGWKTFDPTDGARITDDTKQVLRNFDGAFDFIDYKLNLWAYQLMTGVFKRYLERIWEQIVEILLNNIKLIYFLAFASLSYIIYAKFIRVKILSNSRLLLYSPPNNQKKQIIQDYLNALKVLNNKEIKIEGKDTIDAMIDKIKISNLSDDLKLNIINTLVTYQNQRYLPETKT